jgi:hypothetical protein
MSRQWGDKDKDKGGKHREPKIWGRSKPPKLPKSGKHAAKGKDGKDKGKKGGMGW